MLPYITSAPFFCIEGNPFITRFKTYENGLPKLDMTFSIEGNPFITRFKTLAEISIYTLPSSY